MFYCNVKCKPWPKEKQLDYVTYEILLVKKTLWIESEIWMDLFVTLGLVFVSVLLLG